MLSGRWVYELILRTMRKRLRYLKGLIKCLLFWILDTNLCLGLGSYWIYHKFSSFLLFFLFLSKTMINHFQSVGINLLR